MSRVLLVSPCATPGGAERALAGLARQLPKLGFSPVAALLASGPLEDWLDEVGCETHVLAAHRTRQLHRTLQTVLTLRRLIRDTGAGVVVSNMAKGHIYGGSAALTAGVPGVFWQQGIPEPSPLERTAAAIPANAVVCSSDAAVRAQRRRTPYRRIEKIHLGVPVADIATKVGSGASIRRSLGWDGRPVVGIVGRLERWKGQDDFLQAAAIVARSHSDVCFAVVGGAILGWEGSYPDDLRRLAVELGIADRVHFAGHQAEVYPWFDALDVVVHASHGEPFGLVLVEALAFGKPLVATGAGGPTEIVEDGVSGLLVPPRHPEGLAAAIQRVLKDSDLASRLGRHAAVRATGFSDERMAEHFVDLLRSIIKKADGATTYRPVD